MMTPKHTNAEDDAPPLRLFVYGTLKRGGWNHGRHMTGYQSVEETTVRGRLRWLGAGIPILEVPPEDVLAVGTADHLADMRLAARLSRELAGQPRPEVAGNWDEIPGELFTFDDPETRLPPLDRLEGFQPDGEGSLYHRVLAAHPSGPAWLYTAPTMELASV
jgi:gamma-glutamylcyclotransferase (GGCT)/AIG2-like uncharacterized protein YtfP